MRRAVDLRVVGLGGRTNVGAAWAPIAICILYYFGGSKIPSKAPPRGPESIPRAQKRGPRAIPNESRVGQNSTIRQRMSRNVRYVGPGTDGSGDAARNMDEVRHCAQGGRLEGGRAWRAHQRRRRLGTNSNMNFVLFWGVQDPLKSPSPGPGIDP